jgi:nucleoside-diphosphate-sugar epimerase
MRIVVTGAAGFIGSTVALRAAAAGHEVVAVDALLGGPYPAAVKRQRFDELAATGLKCVQVDLRECDVAGLIGRADAVINEAAMPGQAVSWSDFPLYSSCNVNVVQRLAAACADAGTRLVQVSTSSVYGREAVGDESLPIRPVSPYGVTKAAAEQLVAAYVREHALNAVVLRYFSVYGPGQRPDMAYHLFCEAMLDGRTLTVFGDGRQSRSNTFVDDIAGATLAALDRGLPGEVLNIAGGEGIELLTALAVLADELGAEPRIEWAAAQTGDQRVTAGIAERAAAVLGWRPAVSAEDGLRRQARWHRARRSAAEPS